jgi:hypothetical protein
MARLVRDYGLGVVASDFRAESLAAELNALDAEAIAGFKAASHRAAGELCAERNSDLILDAAETALARGSRPGSLVAV